MYRNQTILDNESMQKSGAKIMTVSRVMGAILGIAMMGGGIYMLVKMIDYLLMPGILLTVMGFVFAVFNIFFYKKLTSYLVKSRLGDRKISIEYIFDEKLTIASSLVSDGNVINSLNSYGEISTEFHNLYKVEEAKDELFIYLKKMTKFTMKKDEAFEEYREELKSILGNRYIDRRRKEI